jgi:hypothetical protein
VALRRAALRDRATVRKAWVGTFVLMVALVGLVAVVGTMRAPSGQFEVARATTAQSR